MDREITFRRIVAGHYVNTETGVEITRDGRRWHVQVPAVANKRLRDMHTGSTKKEAQGVATRYARLIRDVVAAAYAAAAAEYIDREVAPYDDSDRGDDIRADGWPQGLIWAARNAWAEGSYDRARAFAREASAWLAEARIVQVEKAHAAALIEAIDRVEDALDDLVDRGYIYPEKGDADRRTIWKARRDLRNGHYRQAYGWVGLVEKAVAEVERQREERAAATRQRADQFGEIFAPRVRDHRAATGCGLMEGKRAALVEAELLARLENACRNRDEVDRVEQFADAAYLSAEYSKARQTRSDYSAQLIGRQAVIDAAHADALRECPDVYVPCGEPTTWHDEQVGYGVYTQPCQRPARHDDAIGHALVRYPEGTPEYAAYAAELRAELGKWVAGAEPVVVITDDQDWEGYADGIRAAVRAGQLDEWEATRALCRNLGVTTEGALELLAADSTASLA